MKIRLKIRNERDRKAIFCYENMKALYKLASLEPEKYLKNVNDVTIPDSYFLGLLDALRKLAKRLLESDYLYSTDIDYISMINSFRDTYDYEKLADIDSVLTVFLRCFKLIQNDEDFFKNFIIVEDLETLDKEFVEELKGEIKEEDMYIDDVVKSPETFSKKPNELCPEKFLLVNGQICHVGARYGQYNFKTVSCLQDLIDSFDTDAEAIEFIQANTFETYCR